MPAYSLEIRSYARRLWESGNRPQEVRQTIRDRYSLKLSEATLRRWANDDNWSDWKTARQARTSTFANSGDPTLHLCEVLARRSVREHSQIRRYGSLTRDDARLITKDVLEHVIYNYEPDAIIIKHLQGMVMDYIYAYRSNSNSINQTDLQNEPPTKINDAETSTLRSPSDPPAKLIDSPDMPAHYYATISKVSGILEELELKLVEIDQRLERMTSMLSLFDQLEKRMIGFTQEMLDNDEDTGLVPEEYRPPTDHQIIQIYEEEERLQKLLEIWDENEEDTGNWAEKPWLGNS